MEKFDVVIVGASFAGLAVASRLKGDVLLIDRREIGTNQTSACGTLANLIKSIGCAESILQTFDTIFMHGNEKLFEVQLSDHYCTFDYFSFCKLLFSKYKAEFRKERCLKFENRTVYTNKSAYKAKIYVDCSGWSSVIASSVDKQFLDESKLSYAIETEIDYSGKEMWFFINGIVENGYGWLFPAGKISRFGVGSYGKNPKILESLKNFLRKYGLTPNGIHGNYISYDMKRPVLGNIFVVGDSLGHALPLTAEGIRPAIRAGIYCGDVIQKILEGNLSLEEGARYYTYYCLKNKFYYDYLLKVQRKVAKTSYFYIPNIFYLLNMKLIGKFALRKYLNI